MGVLSNKIEMENLKPGDHIYTWRQAYLYAHHGIYVGEGNVIHFTRGRSLGTMLERIFALPKTNYRVPVGNRCSECGDQSFIDGVIISCIDCFLSGGDLYLFEYGVTRAFFIAKGRGGTCTLASSDPPEDVIHRAKYLFKNGFGSFDILKNNCEDFAIYCKTGLLVVLSGQASSFLGAAGAVISSRLPYLTTFSGLTVVGYGMPMVGYGIYCASRLASDIGVRRDVQKVPVEVVTEMYKGANLLSLAGSICKVVVIIN